VVNSITRDTEQQETTSNRTERRTFSVSKEFSSILVDIDSMHNMSRFVCEAIQEKLDRAKNPGKEIALALQNFVELQSIITQPLQAVQSLSSSEGKEVKVKQTSPSFQTEQPTMGDKSLDVHEDDSHKKDISPSHEEQQEETTSLKKEIKEESTREITSDAKQEEISDNKESVSTNETVETKEKLPVSQNENTLSEIDKMKQTAMNKYFNNN